MRKQWLWGGIWLGSFLIVLAGIYPAMGESNKLGGTERSVMEALETPSEDFAKWAEAWVYFSVVGTGSLPEPAPEEFSEDDLGVPEERQLEDTYPDD